MPLTDALPNDTETPEQIVCPVPAFAIGAGLTVITTESELLQFELETAK